MQKEKNTARKYFKEIITNKSDFDKKIFFQLKKILQANTHTLVYYPINSEPKILNYLSLLKKQHIYLSKIDKTNFHLQIYKMPSLQKNWKLKNNKKLPHLLEPYLKKDICNPKIINTAIVPALAIQINNNKIYRLGYGGGFYDRFFLKYPNIKKIALAYDSQIAINKWNIENHDVPFDALITESKYLVF